MKRVVVITLKVLWFIIKVVGYVILLAVYAIAALLGPVLTNIATVAKALLAQYKLL